MPQHLCRCPGVGDFRGQVANPLSGRLAQGGGTRYSTPAGAPDHAPTPGPFRWTQEAPVSVPRGVWLAPTNPPGLPSRKAEVEGPWAAPRRERRKA